MNALDANATYVVTSAPSAQIVTTADLRLQCRIDSDDEDDLLEELHDAAVEKIEADTLVYLRPVTFRLQLDYIPCDVIEIERGPVTAVSGITYVATDGTTATWSSSEYLADVSSMPARVQPAFGYSWPSYRDQAGSIRVTCTGGFAEGACPAQAIRVVKMLVGHWYENREAVGLLDEKVEASYRYMIRSFSRRPI